MVILPEQKKDMRSVRGSRVNLRGGPGTSFGVLGVLNRDQAVEVLRDEGKGWVKLRDQESGRVGWMAAKMLTQKTE
ncbi:MAG: SH3 domain-containing protein [Shimia sp.]|nr:SH3 domain-containing protein [Shimia sp.]